MVHWNSPREDMAFSHQVMFIHNVFIFKKKAYRRGRCLSAEDKIWSGQIRSGFLDAFDTIKRAVSFLIKWLAPRAGKMTQIARCDWLPVRARWSHLARSELPAVSHKQNCPESHTINPLLTKFARSRWLCIGLVLFLRVYGPRLRLRP